MANFERTFQKTLRAEGGMKLSKLPGDSGGQTFAGISRNNWPHWAGWAIIDAGRLDDPRLTPLVRDFYRSNFWEPLRGDEIESQVAIDALFDACFNGGLVVGVKLMQIAVGTVPDGVMGPKTIAAINGLKEVTITADTMLDERLFVLRVARYLGIGEKKKEQRQFYQSWMSRALSGVSS